MKDAEETETIVVTAKSYNFNFKSKAKILINNIPVKCLPNKNGHTRGLHVVAINPLTFEITMAQVFDTFASGFEFENMIRQKRFEDQIIIAAAEDDVTTNLTTESKEWWAKRGSHLISNVGFR